MYLCQTITPHIVETHCPPHHRCLCLFVTHCTLSKDTCKHHRSEADIVVIKNLKNILSFLSNVVLLNCAICIGQAVAQFLSASFILKKCFLDHSGQKRSLYFPSDVIYVASVISKDILCQKKRKVIITSFSQLLESIILQNIYYSSVFHRGSAPQLIQDKSVN